MAEDHLKKAGLKRFWDCFDRLGGKIMNNCSYKTAGKAAVPEEKKEEFNQHILRILDRGGIRKTEQIELGGRTVTVVGPPTPDREGIVSFDYSIFEKRKRETANYNTKTCELFTPDRGYQEFGLVMNVIMAMQEAYSQGKCYFMDEDEPVSVDAYVGLIRGMLGITPDFSHRARMWDMLLFLKNTEGYQNITAQAVWKAYSFDLWELDIDQFMAAYEIDSKEITVPQEIFDGEKDEIKMAPRGTLKYYLYQLMCRLAGEKQEEGLKHFLKELLDADLASRRKLAEDTRYGTIAEVSLYVLPSIIVQAYAVAAERDFWDVWKELEIKGYSDIIADQKQGRNPVSEGEEWILPFYKAIQRKNEDEFIEFWEDKPLRFSEDMKECLSDWQKRFQEISLENDFDTDFDTEDFLAEIVADLDRDWGCRLVDRAFITEFTQHKDDENYKKALLLFRDFMDEDTAYFPELTKKQANRWIIRNNRDEFDFTAMSAFQSLLINHKHRYGILGF